MAYRLLAKLPTGFTEKNREKSAKGVFMGGRFWYTRGECFAGALLVMMAEGARLMNSGPARLSAI